MNGKKTQMSQTTMKLKVKNQNLNKIHQNTKKKRNKLNRTKAKSIRAISMDYIIYVWYRGFTRKIKEPMGENLITEKNEWGDYKVKSLQIKQLVKDVNEDLNKSVSHQIT
jgi:hypothetical protein